MKRSKQFREVTAPTTELYDRVTKLETEILDKLTNLKLKKNKPIACEHMQNYGEQCEEYDIKNDYY